MRAGRAMRAPGRENGDPFIRRCPGCKRETKARGLPDQRKRDLAATFAAAHLVHFEDTNPAANPSRCRVCGLLLLFDHRCPVHIYEERIEWTPDLAEAYREVVEMVAAGGARAVIPWGRAEYVLAYNLAKLWGMRSDLHVAGGAA